MHTHTHTHTHAHTHTHTYTRTHTHSYEYRADCTTIHARAHVARANDTLHTVCVESAFDLAHVEFSICDILHA